MVDEGPRDAALYLRELDQLGSPQELLKYLKDSPFRRACLHANAERQSKTLRWGEVLRSGGIRLSVYTTPGGLTPAMAPRQAEALSKLALRLGAQEVILDMEAPWRGATIDQVTGCVRHAGARGHRVLVTTVPGHPIVKPLGRLVVPALAVQVYDRRNTYSEARLRAICSSARLRAPRCRFDLPAWNKDARRLERHLRNIPACHSTRYWMADNAGVNDLPGQDLLKVIAEFDPALRPA